MGNRAIIIFKDQNEVSPQIYLHWNGGPESVLGFISEMKRRKWLRSDYASARFVQIVGEFFRGLGESVTKDEGLSLGLFPPPQDLKPETLREISHGDNGVYIVECTGEDFKVSNTVHGKLSLNSLELLFKKLGKGYREGCEHYPKEKFEGIAEFFQKQETVLKGAA